MELTEALITTLIGTSQQLLWKWWRRLQKWYLEIVRMVCHLFSHLWSFCCLLSHFSMLRALSSNYLLGTVLTTALHRNHLEKCIFSLSLSISHKIFFGYNTRVVLIVCAALYQFVWMRLWNYSYAKYSTICFIQSYHMNHLFCQCVVPLKITLKIQSLHRMYISWNLYVIVHVPHGTLDLQLTQWITVENSASIHWETVRSEQLLLVD